MWVSGWQGIGSLMSRVVVYIMEGMFGMRLSYRDSDEE